MLPSGAWGKEIHEKNLKQKISWHCSFKYFESAIYVGRFEPTWLDWLPRQKFWRNLCASCMSSFMRTSSLVSKGIWRRSSTTLCTPILRSSRCSCLRGFRVPTESRKRALSESGGYKEMSSILADQWRPRIWGWGGVLRGLSQWVQLYTGAQINFGDLTPYLTFGQNWLILRPPPNPPPPCGTETHCAKNAYC